MRQILTSLPIQRLEQRYQHGPGHIVLIAYFPRDIRPAQHACTAPGLDLHYVVDVSFQPAGTCPALCVTRSQRMKKISHRRFAAAVRTDGKRDFLMAVRINLSAKALQHAAVSAVKERAGCFKPVQRRLCARAQFTAPPQRIGRLGRR